MASQPQRRNPGWVTALLGWYRRHRRTLPWRSRPTPYRVWVSEIMLQQTRVETVIPYFARFMAQFPTVRGLAAADLQTVLKAWEGLGYYARARNLHRAARQLIAAGRPGFPTSSAAWRALPGIGPYTAAAIASIADGEAVPVVDGNVLRVFTRFWGIADDIRRTATRLRLSQRLQEILSPPTSGTGFTAADPGTFNQAIMELGALVCLPKNPACRTCPLRRECIAFRDDRVAELPVKAAARAVPHYEVAVGVIWKNGRILVQQRPLDGMLGGLWEFPGGKRQPGETLAATARREIREETGLRVRVTGSYGSVKHAYSHFRITLTAFRCAVVSGRAPADSARTRRWLRPGQLHELPFPRANQRILARVLEETRDTSAHATQARQIKNNAQRRTSNSQRPTYGHAASHATT